MTDPIERFQFRPRPLPEAYLREHARNMRWLDVLRAAIRRGLSDREACDLANRTVPEALEPSQFLDGNPFPDERREQRRPSRADEDLFALPRPQPAPAPLVARSKAVLGRPPRLHRRVLARLLS